MAPTDCGGSVRDGLDQRQVRASYADKRAILPRRSRNEHKTETVTNDRAPVAEPVSRPRSRTPATVSASEVALHLDCTLAAFVGTGRWREDATLRSIPGMPMILNR
jgi:hypothetical protein